MPWMGTNSHLVRVPKDTGLTFSETSKSHNTEEELPALLKRDRQGVSRGHTCAVYHTGRGASPCSLRHLTQRSTGQTFTHSASPPLRQGAPLPGPGVPLTTGQRRAALGCSRGTPVPRLGIANPEKPWLAAGDLGPGGCPAAAQLPALDECFPERHFTKIHCN